MTDILQSYIGGRWRDGAGARYTTEYPADGSVVAELHAAMHPGTVTEFQLAQFNGLNGRDGTFQECGHFLLSDADDGAENG